MISFFVLFLAVGPRLASTCIPTSNSEEAIGGPFTSTSTSTISSATTTTTPATTTTTTTAPACLPGWVYFAMTMNCYLAVSLPTLAITQPDAEIQCNSCGVNGHLASIHSPQENSFIFSLFSNPMNPIILGLFRLPGSTLADFQWYDGTPFDYSNWANHPPNVQPDNAGGMQYCVSMLTVQTFYGDGTILSDRREWNDNPCSYPQRYYVCQLPRL